MLLDTGFTNSNLNQRIFLVSSQCIWQPRAKWQPKTTILHRTFYLYEQAICTQYVEINNQIKKPSDHLYTQEK